MRTKKIQLTVNEFLKKVWMCKKKFFFFYLDYYLNKFKIFLTSDISYDKKIIFDISEMIWVIIHVPAYQY